MAQSPAQPVVLDRADDVSVGVNLAWRLESLIQSGRLGAGERLPGVRDLAAGAGVNTNTVRAVYRRLEQQGLVSAEQGRGTFVSPYAPVTPPLEELAAEVASQAIARGIDPRELARALYAGSPSTDPFEEAGDTFAGRGRTSDEERTARETLRGQIARLEMRLAAYPETSGRTGVSSSHLGLRPRLVGLDELEAIRDDLVDRLKRAQAAAERRGEREDAARAWREAATRDPTAHRWESVSAKDTGERGCGRYEVRPAWGPVGTLMNWWRLKISSGCP
jgi:DNA-binding transcriptional regulator YhcF (GntR family)